MSQDKQTTIIEINGVKLEVDLRNAKRIDTLTVGDRVKCLVKGYGGGMSTYPGIVAGFEPFPSLPSIVVAYLDTSYASKGLVFKTFNSETKDFEIVADLDQNSLELNRDDVLRTFARDESVKERELQEIRDRRNFFEANFGAWFKDTAPV